MAEQVAWFDHHPEVQYEILGVQVGDGGVLRALAKGKRVDAASGGVGGARGQQGDCRADTGGLAPTTRRYSEMRRKRSSRRRPLWHSRREVMIPRRWRHLRWRSRETLPGRARWCRISTNAFRWIPRSNRIGCRRLTRNSRSRAKTMLAPSNSWKWPARWIWPSRATDSYCRR